MLSRTPANLPPLVTGQAIASPSSTHSNKRLCEAWPGSSRSELLLEPTSVLDINSPSPSSTLSSSIAGSNESGPVPIESKAVAISGLLCEDFSDGQFLDCTSFSQANEGQIWEIAEDDGVAYEEDFAMGEGISPSWVGSEIWAESGGPWEKFYHWQDAGGLATLDSVDEPCSRLNGRPEEQIDVETPAMGVESQSKHGSVTQAREKSSSVEPFDWFSLSSGLLRGSKLEESMDGLIEEAAGKGEVVDGKLEFSSVPCFQPGETRKRGGGTLIGGVVQQCSGSQDQKMEDVWLLPEWMTAELTEQEEKVTAPLRRMQCLEDILPGSPAEPMQEGWLPAEIENAPPPAQPRQLVHEQFQQRLGVGGLSKLRCEYHRPGDLHEARNSGFNSGAATASPRATLSASFPMTTSVWPPNITAFASFPHRPAITRCLSTPLLPKSGLSLHPSLQNREFSAKFPHPNLQPSHHRSPHLLQQFPSVSANNRGGHPQLASQSPRRPPLAGSSQQHSPRSQFLLLPNNHATQGQSVGLPERLHRPHEAEFLQKHIQCHLGTERRLQQHGGQYSFPVLPRSVPSSENRQLQIPKLDSSPPRCVGKTVSMNDLLIAGGQLSMAAKAAEQGDIGMTQAILARLNQLNSPDGQPSQRAAFHFNQALAGRLAGSGSFSSCLRQSSSSLMGIINKIGAYKSFCEVSPLPQFAHFTANQAILEAVEGEDHVHVIDFSLGLGGQWASFMQELSQRSGGPPHLRITTVGGCANSLEMQLARETLLQFGRELKVSLQFHALPVARLDCVMASMLQCHEKEAIAVNLGFSLDPFLSEFSCANSFNTCLQLVKGLSPKVVTVIDNKVDCEDSASFVESLQFYACLFESLECSKLARESVLSIENILFAPKIASYLDAQRRMENLAPWRSLLQKVGFSSLNFSKAAEAHAEYLIKSLNSGFRFDKQQGSLLLGWHSKPLVSASAWAC